LPLPRGANEKKEAKKGRKIAKKGHKIAIFSLYLLYICTMFENPKEARPNCPSLPTPMNTLFFKR